MQPSEIQQILSDRLARVEATIAGACAKARRSRDEVRLIAVTKTVSAAVTAMLPRLGVVDLAENRPQTLWGKVDAVPNVRWHFIGHLQRNKIDRTLPLMHWLHSVDSVRLLEALQSECVKQNRHLSIFIEVNASREEQKQGFAHEDCAALGPVLARCDRLSILGLMGMAAYSDDPENSRPTFAAMFALRERLRQEWGLPLPELSLGMSNDYVVAIEEGATCVRLGTTLFEGLDGELPGVGG
ncbi:YggS family pyridoxal phosphate-dependent enzyme [Tuwongella immobilis]|uniref:Pyridoxal phosphate homeostasis protein n=1 Tax=Tuwongella immobilis TaxID=692036 RepID=A0A6C2YK96_9BACT|nr:YggS family pyridoxal phosphate-dependent enzyme [Tuwongella immobilis]VIP01998.1 Uncharacterized protein OS=Blastopirellula marina DSM 3645 GN=DSM3645_27246 PE=3 SV=1: Ala_racemase_N [Tuwongella immobilis]VTS00081.1 Uncharacterized protein OS=Blastopirellula marina DSM 3645 GN=DSM3645_27246 PE=3 SV=1: Ala_racemase_N [Tuwongella immobilis]